jgi:hypothetical protein
MANDDVAEMPAEAVTRGSPAKSIPVQKGWRVCRKCQGLFHGRGASRCPAGAAHDATGSKEYVLAMADAVPGAQSGWRWCKKCQALFFASSTSACPAGAGHDGSASGPYSVAHNPGAGFTGQKMWFWCKKCSSLYFEGSRGVATVCPKGGVHDGVSSGKYGVGVVRPPAGATESLVGTTLSPPFELPAGLTLPAGWWPFSGDQGVASPAGVGDDACARFPDGMGYATQEEVTLDSVIPAGGGQLASFMPAALMGAPSAELPLYKPGRMAMLLGRQPRNSEIMAHGRSQPFCAPGTLDGNGEPVHFVRWDSPIWSPSVRKVSTSRMRPRTTQIVLHETEDFNESLKRGEVHFFIDMHGIIHQCSDAGSVQPHATHEVVNEQSIGIEIANDPWLGGGGGENPPPRERAPWLGIAGAKTYVLAHRHQMEKAIFLIQRLCEIYPDIAPGYTAGATLGSFLAMFSVFTYHDPSGDQDVFYCRRDSDWDPVVSAKAERPGLLSHAAVSKKKDRGDGIGPALYAFYRLSRGLSAADAYVATRARLGAGPTSKRPAELAGIPGFVLLL